MEKLSIFGGQGFIGSNFTRRFSEKSLVLDRDDIKPLTKDALFLRSTVDNYNVFKNLHIDIDTNLNHLMDVLPNVDGTFNFISSWFVYGNGYDRPESTASEKSHCAPKGMYSITKYCAEQLIQSYCDTFNKNYRIIRLCNVVGGDSGANKKKNATEYLISKILVNEDIEIYDGDNYRNYLHVDDVCDAIALIADKGDLNTIYNVGSTHSYRLIDLMEYVIQKTGSTSKIKLVKTPRFHEIVQTKDFFMNTNKIRGLGFVQKYDIWQTFDKIIAEKQSQICNIPRLRGHTVNIALIDEALLIPNNNI